MPDLSDRRRRMSFATALLVLERMGIDLHEISILAVGTNRNYRGEVLAQSPGAGVEITRDTTISLEIGFSSAVDSMPYQFFAGLSEATKVSSKWEDRARRFMAPFDAMVARYRALALGERLRFSLATADTDRLRSFLKLFDLDMPRQSRDTRELWLWAALLPSFHNWGGNARQVGQVLTLLLGKRCSIEENVPVRYKTPSNLQSRLGSTRHTLGRQMILGTGFVDCDYTYRVHVHGVASDQVRDWMPDGKERRRLDWLLEKCMPGHLDYLVAVHAGTDRHRLGDDAMNYRLGYNTRLRSETAGV
jgi:predicted component of type VI protein secretion system